MVGGKWWGNVLCNLYGQGLVAGCGFFLGFGVVELLFGGEVGWTRGGIALM